MQWNKEQIATAIGVLARHTRIIDALDEIATAIGRPVTSDQLKHALKKRGHKTASHYLGSDLVGKAARKAVEQYHADLDRDIEARLYNNPDMWVTPEEAPIPAVTYRKYSVPFSVPSITDFEPDPNRILKIMVCPDAHHPYVDKLAWQTFLKACEVVKPDVLVIIGDFADVLSLSAHPKSPKDETNFEKELSAVNLALDEVSALNIHRVVFCAGNHCHRIDRYIRDRAPELYGMMHIQDLLRLDERGFEYVPYGDFIRIGQIAFSHDVGRCGVNAARQSLQDFGDNLVFGHSHRAQIVYGGTVEGKTHVCMNVGWLGDYDAIDYRNRPTAKREWQHAFGFVYQTADGVSFCNLVPIINGRCVVDGKLVDGNV